MEFHPPLRSPQWGETKLLVESMGIARQQAPAAQSLKPGMFHDALHQALAQALSAKLHQDKYITKIGVGRVVRDNSGKTDLLASKVHSKAQRVLNRARYNNFRNSFCPIALGQKRVNRLQVQARAIRTDEKLASPKF